MTEDLYRTLNVPPEATAEEIQKSYRALARRYHPDLNPQTAAANVMAAINAAYEVLSEPSKRAAYDRANKKENSAVDGAVLVAAREALIRSGWKLLEEKSNEFVLKNGSRQVRVFFVPAASTASVRQFARRADGFSAVLAVHTETGLRLPNESTVVIDLMRAAAIGSFPDSAYRSLFERFL